MERYFNNSVLKLTFDTIGECILYEDRHGNKIYCNKSYIDYNQHSFYYTITSLMNLFFRYYLLYLLF